MKECRASQVDRRLTLLLRVAAALCFIGHGAFGILGKAAWIPYFSVVGIPEHAAFRLMPIVGVMDLALGVLALIRPRTWIWAWMTIWAMWTAMLRPFAGESAWEALERAGNYGVPLALLLIARAWPWGSVAAVLRWSTVLLLLGHGMLACSGKHLLVGHWHAILPSVDAPQITYASGAVELMLALLIAIEPTAAIGLIVCCWKVATESLFLATGAPCLEFVERAGSYAAPLSLAIWLRCRWPCLSAQVTSATMLACVCGLSLCNWAGAEESPASSLEPSRTSSNLPDNQLVKELRSGGHILVFRHCATDWTQQDYRSADFTARENQRNLSPLGVSDARALREAFTRLAIPHGIVKCSELFRCRDTADLAFDGGEPTRALMGRDGAALRALLAEPPPDGTNAIFVTHQVTLMAAEPALSLHEVEEGDCVVFKPGPNPERIAHLAIRDWERLAGMPARESAGDLGDAAPMAAAASRFLDSLDDAQRTMASLPFDASRTAWAATPEPDRVGIVLRDLDQRQRELVFDLLATVLAPAAVQLVRDTMSVERVLTYPRNGSILGPEMFYVTIHGKPSATEDWAWRLEGHHVFITCTVHDGRVGSATPMFLGAFPTRTFVGARLLADEQDISRALLVSLDEDQRRDAIVGDRLPLTVMTRDVARAEPLRPGGLPFNRLDADQAEMLQRLIATFTNRLQPTAAAVALRRITTAGLDRVSLALIGGQTADAPVYWRIQGPTFVIEFLNSLEDTTHIHTVWRDFERDFAAHAVATKSVAAVPSRPVPTTSGSIPTIVRTFATLDANGDGTLTAAELDPGIRDRLMRADANADGHVTRDELRAARRRAGMSDE